MAVSWTMTRPGRYEAQPTEGWLLTVDEGRDGWEWRLVEAGAWYEHARGVARDMDSARYDARQAYEAVAP